MNNFKTYTNFVNELNQTSVSGTKSGWTTSLEDKKYELKKDVKGARIGDFTNVILPKGTIIHNLPGGVFADHISLKNKYTTKYGSNGPQWFDKPGFSGVSIRQMPGVLKDIEKNSKVLEYNMANESSVNEGEIEALLGDPMMDKKWAAKADKLAKGQLQRERDELRKVGFGFGNVWSGSKENMIKFQYVSALLKESVNEDFAKDYGVAMKKAMSGDNRLLAQMFLSSAEYQKAKKLKGFDAKDWKWDSKKDLYRYQDIDELADGNCN